MLCKDRQCRMPIKEVFSGKSLWGGEKVSTFPNQKVL